jgi:hypothetical protein
MSHIIILSQSNATCAMSMHHNTAWHACIHSHQLAVDMIETTQDRQSAPSDFHGRSGPHQTHSQSEVLCQPPPPSLQAICFQGGAERHTHLRACDTGCQQEQTTLAGGPARVSELAFCCQLSIITNELMTVLQVHGRGSGMLT